MRQPAAPRQYQNEKQRCDTDTRRDERNGPELRRRHAHKQKRRAPNRAEHQQIHEIAGFHRRLRLTI
jgi:hypothetical protein